MTNDNPTCDPIVVRSLRDILLIELQREVPCDEGPVMQMQLVERKLVQMAIDGDLAAIKEIHDRTDGKVPSAPRPEKKPETVTVRWRDCSDNSHASADGWAPDILAEQSQRGKSQ